MIGSDWRSHKRCSSSHRASTNDGRVRDGGEGSISLLGSTVPIAADDSLWMEAAGACGYAWARCWTMLGSVSPIVLSASRGRDSESGSKRGSKRGRERGPEKRSKRNLVRFPGWRSEKLHLAALSLHLQLLQHPPKKPSRRTQVVKGDDTPSSVRRMRLWHCWQGTAETSPRVCRRIAFMVDKRGVWNSAWKFIRLALITAYRNMGKLLRWQEIGLYSQSLRDRASNQIFKYSSPVACPRSSSLMATNVPRNPTVISRCIYRLVDATFRQNISTYNIRFMIGC